MTYEELWRRLVPLYDVGEAKAIVRWLLDVRFGLTLADILCGRAAELPASEQRELKQMTDRLAEGEPVQYVAGLADFCGRQLHVGPGVLIPRPETAELCRWILEERGRRNEEGGTRSEEQGRRKEEGEYSDAVSILDIGTGSGCIAITLAVELPGARVSGWDISEAALAIARQNAEHLGVSVSFEQRDILDASLFALHSSLYDTIVSNPPYIEPAERQGMEKNVLDYEPDIALFAPEDHPTIFYERIGDYAINALRPGGHLFFELNPLTADSVADYLRQEGFRQIQIRQDSQGKDRLLKATKI